MPFLGGETIPGTHLTGPLVISKKQLTDNTTIALLNQTVSATPTQAEVQAISDKVDEIIQKLIDTGVIKAS
jgi:hypothetical protein